jgi:hypothetical protein
VANFGGLKMTRAAKSAPGYKLTGYAHIRFYVSRAFAPMLIGTSQCVTEVTRSPWNFCIKEVLIKGIFKNRRGRKPAAARKGRSCVDVLVRF